jgi:hypothetical protein
MIVMMKMKCCRTGTLEPSVPSKAPTITAMEIEGKMCKRSGKLNGEVHSTLDGA